ncbi:zinc finger protein 830 [Episyrphus balteatus]|uniref:zinc finger protein 830 n=1 Tax=Episyrphus balteatus TaxID=286459 RepID=UPI002485BDA2|nr:zinc finger protein 830 [Episyrphus balteatus]
MATTSKVAKKKYTQNDLRRLMQEQKSKSQQRVVEQKIDSPLAKYNDQGQLTCILCKSVVRSESVWKVHINTKAHKANVEIAKQLKEQLQKSSSSNQNQLKRSNQIKDESISKEKKIKLANEKLREPIHGKAGIPSDFFDNGKTNPTVSILAKGSIESSTTKTEVEVKDEVLPEGFFDDPIKDAKIRNLEYKDPQDEEWDRFQREIKEAATLSNEIIAGEQEEATVERQIKEIDEQIERWSKVLDLEKKKEYVSSKLKERPVAMVVDSSEEESEADDDENFDEFPDWRAKKFHR